MGDAPYTKGLSSRLPCNAAEERGDSSIGEDILGATPSGVSRETSDGRKASRANEGRDESLHAEAVDVIVSRETSGYHWRYPGARFPLEQQVSGPVPPEPPDAFTSNAQAAGSGPHTTGEAPAHSMQYLDSASSPHITGGASTPAFSMTKVPRASQSGSAPLML